MDEANFLLELEDFSDEPEDEVSVPAVGQNSRFKNTNEEEKLAFKEGQKNKNTAKKTTYDVKLFLDFLSFKNDNRQPQDINGQELNKLLEDFFMVVKKKDNTEYEPASLRGILGSITRHLQGNLYNHCIMTSPTFAGMREMLNAKYKVSFNSLY